MSKNLKIVIATASVAVLYNVIAGLQSKKYGDCTFKNKLTNISDREACGKKPVLPIIPYLDYLTGTIVGIISPIKPSEDII